MSIEAFVAQYGYVAVLLGTLLEGETVLILGGFAAHRGYLSLPGVIAVAFIGAFSGDQLFFWLGRSQGSRLLQRRPGWKRRLFRAQQLLERHRRPVMLLFRFIYGARAATPFALGFGPTPYRQYLVYTLAGGLLWAIVVGTGGYLFGHALEILLGDLRRYERDIFLVLVVGALMVWIGRRLLSRRH